MKKKQDLGILSKRLILGSRDHNVVASKSHNYLPFKYRSINIKVVRRTMGSISIERTRAPSVEVASQTSFLGCFAALK
ncbi:MAG: hypothetical protein GWP06_16600 [Actinobacteria bacterium]|nr:hypothetical protein [Actinomycetota bacterium]